MIDFIIRAGLV